MKTLSFALALGLMILTTSVARGEDQFGELAEAARQGESGIYYDPFSTAVAGPSSSGIDPALILLMSQMSSQGGGNNSSDDDLIRMLILLTSTSQSSLPSVDFGQSVNDGFDPFSSRRLPPIVVPPVIAAFDPFAVSIASQARAAGPKRHAGHHRARADRQQRRSMRECTSNYTRRIRNHEDDVTANGEYLACVNRVNGVSPESAFSE